MKDYYAILDIDPIATADDIKAQYRFLMQAFHPDKFTSNSPLQKAKAEAKAKEINEAYGVLSNHANRAEYDRSTGRKTYTPPPPTNRPSPPPQQRPNNNSLVLTFAPGVTLDLVRVPAGAFLMGSTDADKSASGDEKPQHKVKLDEYLIGKYEVTNEQYAAYAKAKGLSWTMPQGKGKHPVVSVSWDDAVAFCAWVSQTSGRRVQLPTEAQWEKAARGTDGRIYPWGNEAPNANLANFNQNVKDTTEVGKYSPAGDSPYGLADMAGNVWEWTSSLYKGYPYKADDGREEQNSRDARVLRGGAFGLVASLVRCANRYHPPPVRPLRRQRFSCCCVSHLLISVLWYSDLWTLIRICFRIRWVRAGSGEGYPSPAQKNA